MTSRRLVIRDRINSLVAQCRAERSIHQVAATRMRSEAERAATEGRTDEAARLNRDAAIHELEMLGRDAVVFDGIRQPKPMATGDREHRLDALKRSREYYTLAAAASIMAPDAGQYGVVLMQLIEASRQGNLSTRRPSRLNFRHRDPRHGRSRVSLADEIQGEAHWNELNCWLDEHHAHIAWRFSKPGDPLDEGTAPASKDALAITPHRGPNKTNGAAPSTGRKSAQQAWNDKFINALRELGHDPAALPPEKRGASGVRAQVRQKLGVGVKNKAFARAWDRAKGDHVISFRPLDN